MKKSTKWIVSAGIIAALYVALTFVASAMGLASGAIQVRISEALCILPMFTVSAVPGLAIGCFLANLLTGCHILDVIFGTVATLLGAVGTRLLKKNKFLACLPPILSNMIIVPIVLQKVYMVEDAYWYLVLTVGAGEVISVGILGLLLHTLIMKNQTLQKIIKD